MMYAILGIGIIYVTWCLHQSEKRNGQLAELNTKFAELNNAVIKKLRDVEERNEAVATQPGYFFYAGHFGASVADELNFLDHAVLMGFITVEEHTEKVNELLQPYLDIKNA